MKFLETVGNSDLILPAEEIVVAHLGDRLLTVYQSRRAVQKVQSAVASQQHHRSPRAKLLSYIHDRQIVDSRGKPVVAVAEPAELPSSRPQSATNPPNATAPKAPAPSATPKAPRTAETSCAAKRAKAKRPLGQV